MNTETILSMGPIEHMQQFAPWFPIIAGALIFIILTLSIVQSCTGIHHKYHHDESGRIAREQMQQSQRYSLWSALENQRWAHENMQQSEQACQQAAEQSIHDSSLFDFGGGFFDHCFDNLNDSFKNFDHFDNGMNF